jgi:hypothetical protein
VESKSYLILVANTKPNTKKGGLADSHPACLQQQGPSSTRTALEEVFSPWLDLMILPLAQVIVSSMNGGSLNLTVKFDIPDE